MNARFASQAAKIGPIVVEMRKDMPITVNMTSCEKNCDQGWEIIVDREFKRV